MIQPKMDPSFQIERALILGVTCPSSQGSFKIRTCLISHLPSIQTRRSHTHPNICGRFFTAPNNHSQISPSHLSTIWETLPSAGPGPSCSSP
jgi:hypothetical protein